jgi:hypothetical protein
MNGTRKGVYHGLNYNIQSTQRVGSYKTRRIKQNI